jgi:mRNA-degrading endonuclease toxin of MazEF toxin-antitoxin module
MRVGDVFWVEFPPRGGHAQAGRRPAIVAQTLEASDRLPTVLLIPLTTQLDALRFPGTVLVEPDADNGLRRTSVALVFQIAATDRRFIAERSGQVSAAVVRELWDALDDLTGRRPGRASSGP